MFRCIAQLGTYFSVRSKTNRTSSTCFGTLKMIRSIISSQMLLQSVQNDLPINIIDLISSRSCTSELQTKGMIKNWAGTKCGHTLRNVFEQNNYARTIYKYKGSIALVFLLMIIENIDMSSTITLHICLTVLLSTQQEILRANRFVFFVYQKKEQVLIQTKPRIITYIHYLGQLLFYKLVQFFLVSCFCTQIHKVLESAKIPKNI